MAAITPASSGRSSDPTTRRFFDHSGAARINTDAVITKALREQYPQLELVVTPSSSACDLLRFAGAGHAIATPVADDSSIPSSLQWTYYIPPARRAEGAQGYVGDAVIFGKFIYKWKGDEFIVYIVDGRDGSEAWPRVVNYYILATERYKVDELLLAAGLWGSDLHNEILVFDGGDWESSAELWQSVNKSSWDAVILDKDMKKALIDDHNSFFDSKETYAGLKVPWKRGIIYYGPPGNGKTISIKATMHMLSDRNPSIPSLYVRSLNSWMGPEFGIKMVFAKAREYAPCYLIFEDLDTIINDEVRSYFLNEVDGLKSNDGIFMIGSTNHLDRLDPGIAKRPSRFDRKYLFPNPDLEQRVAYCKFWQKKLSSSKDIEFPDRLCRAIADITDKFSFAYIQEAFVAALLALARDGGKSGFEVDDSDEAWELVSDGEGSSNDGEDDDGLEKLKLWVEIKKQVEILRQGIDDGGDEGDA